ncbi:hypothetical protein MNBD_ALPHA01-300 [hydrothermal vent metagenome]|uniref:YHS domain-containing protein n=2 Tax=hydrothermal vent metagenome TaxID=652676 RepID=A0A3B0SIV8_9ZZZZ
MNNFTKMLMLTSTLVLLIGGGLSVYFTFQGNKAVTIVNEDKNGIAIDGFDAVAYHTAATAQKGLNGFQVTWAGSIWYFTSLENRQAFSENPEEYAPQYGGYDPFGMAMNGTAQPATPELWAIEDGKLYLFHSGQTRALWYENRAENQKNAHIQWTRLKQQARYKTEME